MRATVVFEDARGRVERWTIRHASNLGAMGDCNYDRREIRVRSSLSADDALATVIHETLHASLPDLAEESVCRVEENIMAALKAWRQRDAV